MSLYRTASPIDRYVFKIGDRVKVIRQLTKYHHNQNVGFKIGDIGIITDLYDKRPGCCWVKIRYWITPRICFPWNRSWHFFKDELELVE